MIMSEKFDQIGTALIQARLEINNPTKSASAHRYKYANITDVLDSVVTPCLKHGILIQQHVETTDSIEYSITTVLLHPASNQHITSHIKVAPELSSGKNTPIQELGAAITYMKRYALLAIFAIAGEDDDNDGATSTAQYGPQRQASTAQYGPQRQASTAQYVSQRQSSTEQYVPQKQSSTTYITHQQSEEIIRLADSNTRVIEYLKSAFNVNSINQLRSSDYASVIDLLNKAKKEKQ